MFVGGWAGSRPVVGSGDGCVTVCCDTASRRYGGQLTASLAVGYAYVRGTGECLATVLTSRNVSILIL
jgi:hypothetical protein